MASSLTHATSTAGAPLSYQERVLLGVEGVEDLRRSPGKMHELTMKAVGVSGD